MIELVEKSKDAKYLKTRSGLQAIEKTHRNKINCKNNNNITGSINLDLNLRSLYQNANRWDYAIGYIGSDDIEKVWFIEIHPAETSEVEKIINKAIWLRNWGMTKATELWNNRKGLYWVASGRVHIRQHDNYRKRLALCGVGMPVGKLAVM